MRHIPGLLMLLLLPVIAGGLSSVGLCQNAGDSETGDIPDLLQRLERIERESRDASGRSTGARTDRLAVLFEQSHLGTAAVGGERTRYFVTRVIVMNLSDERLPLVTDDLVLVADGDEYRLSGLHEQLRASAIYIGRESLEFGNVAPPDELTVPPGGTASLWLMYSGLPPAPRVPEMTIRIPTGDGIQEIDVNEYQRGILGLRIERLGPDACLALLTVSGELNSINAAGFADEMDQLGQQGVARVVVAWSETTAPLSDQIEYWLLSPGTNSRNPDLPVLPASISEMHFVMAPGNRNRRFSVNGVTIHADAEAAVMAALRTAYEAVPRDELRRQVVSGSPLTRAAALTHGSERLASEDLPLVLRSLKDVEETVRRGAIAALAHFSEPAALDALVTTVHGASADLSRAALEALASSRFPVAHARLREYLADAPAEARGGVIDVLSRFPRTEWSGMLFEFAADEDPQLRLAALQALVRVGHAELLSVLTDALGDEDERIRDFAFARLAEGTDAGSEAAAMEYALATLGREPPDSTVSQLLSRTRDQRAIPLLLRHLDEPGERRNEVIQLIARVAGRAAIEVLVDRYDGFSQTEQDQVLGVLRELNAPQAREFAIAAIRAGQQNLMPQATRILADDADPEAVEILAEVLRSDDPQSWSSACNALKMIGTGDARRALLAARESGNAAKRREAARALERLVIESPARYVIDQGIERMREEKFDEAERLLTLAIQFDDEQARAWSYRGFVRLQVARLPEAQLDFEQAADLDPYDSQAVTGMALTRTLQGECLDGIRIINENAAKFTDDAVYAYNSACVYGRALERIVEADTTGEHAARADEYQTQALLLLKRSIELKLPGQELMRTDPDLDSLRGLDEFQTLLRGIEQNPGETDSVDAASRQ